MKVDEPRFYHEAVKQSQWRQALIEEVEALENNGTWQIINLPLGKKPIGCKWVYRVKYNSDGSIHLYKARLVIQGDHQEEGVDYTETFAPVARMTSVQCFLSVAIAKAGNHISWR